MAWVAQYDRSCLIPNSYFNFSQPARVVEKMGSSKRPLPSVKNIFDDIVQSSTASRIKFIPPGFKDNKTSGMIEYKQ